MGHGNKMDELQAYCKEIWPNLHGYLDFSQRGNDCALTVLGRSFAMQKIKGCWMVFSCRVLGVDLHADICRSGRLVIINTLEQTCHLWYGRCIKQDSDLIRRYPAVASHFDMVVRHTDVVTIRIGSVYVCSDIIASANDNNNVAELNQFITNVEARADAVKPLLHDILPQTIARKIARYLCFFLAKKDDSRQYHVKVQHNRTAA
jgi:hypothetical protein